MTHVEPPVEPPEPDPTTLLDAVNRLANNVTDLTTRLDVSAKVAGRARFASYLAVFAVTVVAILGTLGWLKVNAAVDATAETAAQNQTQAVQACVNANDARAANLALWQFVLRLTTANDPEPDPTIEALGQWIKRLYQPHDCTDLGRVYEIPPPPVFPTE